MDGADHVAQAMRRASKTVNDNHEGPSAGRNARQIN
jgi:hypothetical protein